MDLATREQLPLQQREEQNILLRALPAEDFTALAPLLTPVPLPVRQVLAEPGAPLDSVWFPREGVVSLIAPEQEGGAIEVATTGNEGVVGMPVLLGSEAMGLRILVQITGSALSVPAAAFRQFLDEHPDTRNFLLGYANYFIEQVAQGVACNRLHTLEERCARWLLLTHDRVQGDTFDLSHEFLAHMLGVRRAGVTVALGSLQSAGMLRYSRAHITILDREALEQVGCDCYRITRAAYSRFLARAGNGAGIDSRKVTGSVPRG